MSRFSFLFFSRISFNIISMIFKLNIWVFVEQFLFNFILSFSTMLLFCYCCIFCSLSICIQHYSTLFFFSIWIPMYVFFVFCFLYSLSFLFISIRNWNWFQFVLGPFSHVILLQCKYNAGEHWTWYELFVVNVIVAFSRKWINRSDEWNIKWKTKGIKANENEEKKLK